MITCCTVLYVLLNELTDKVCCHHSSPFKQNGNSISICPIVIIIMFNSIAFLLLGWLRKRNRKQRSSWRLSTRPTMTSPRSVLMLRCPLLTRQRYCILCNLLQKKRSVPHENALLSQTAWLTIVSIHHIHSMEWIFRCHHFAKFFKSHPLRLNTQSCVSVLG